jgi:hypothetical protein
MMSKYIRPGFDFALRHFVEESGEALAAAGKTLLWGRKSVNPELEPEQQEINEEWLEREVLDAIFAAQRLLWEIDPVRWAEMAKPNGSGMLVAVPPPKDAEMLAAASLSETILSSSETVECIEAWDTFNALTVGKMYEILFTRDGMVFVRGNTGHIGGWWPSHFKHVEPAEHS